MGKQAQAGQKEVDKQAKGLFANMCKALGKGPIPEPGKSKPIGDDMDDDEGVDVAQALAQDKTPSYEDIYAEVAKVTGADPEGCKGPGGVEAFESAMKAPSSD